MKWFKHFYNASSSMKLQRVIDEFGVEGYGHYFLLLELLTEKFDGSSTEIELHFEEISAKVRIKFSKKLETFVQKLADFSLLSFQISGKVYKIDCPILLELQDKDSKYNRKKIASRSQIATLDKEEDIYIKKIQKKEIVVPTTIENFDYTHPLDLPNDPKPKQKKFKPDLELLYSDYPRKEGKKKAFERLGKIITSEEIFTQVHAAIKNYAKQSASQETRFIKQFSSFVSVWEDYLNPTEKKLTDLSEDEALAYFENKLKTEKAFEVNHV